MEKYVMYGVVNTENWYWNGERVYEDIMKYCRDLGLKLVDKKQN